MPTDLVQLISNATQPAIFATLFIYLFLKSREDAAQILLRTREDGQKHEEQLRAEAADRERYYRDTQLKQAQMLDQQGRVLETLTASLKQLADQVERIERRLEASAK